MFNFPNVIWAHHEKLLVIDEEVAFVSGLDLARGHLDIHEKYPIFDHEKNTFYGNDYWNQFNTKPLVNLIKSDQRDQPREWSRVFKINKNSDFF